MIFPVFQIVEIEIWSTMRIKTKQNKAKQNRTTMKEGKKTKRHRDRETGKNEYFMHLVPFTVLLPVFEQGSSHSNFVQGPKNYVANPTLYI